MSTIISIGKARLKVVGLNPQRLTEQSEARLPAHPTFKGMDYQKTGMGERTVRHEVMTVPHILGGLDAMGWLRAQHEAQTTVNYWRLGSNFLGTRAGSVQVRELTSDEERFHPFTGIGRILRAEIGLVFV